VKATATAASGRKPNAASRPVARCIFFLRFSCGDCVWYSPQCQGKGMTRNDELFG